MPGKRSSWQQRAAACETFEQKLKLAEEVFRSGEATGSQTATARGAINALQMVTGGPHVKKDEGFANNRFHSFRLSLVDRELL